MEQLSEDELCKIFVGLDAASLLALPKCSITSRAAIAESEDWLWRRLLERIEIARKAGRGHDGVDEIVKDMAPILADGRPFHVPDFWGPFVGAKEQFCLCMYMTKRRLPSLPDALRNAAAHNHRGTLRVLLRARADPNVAADTGAFGVGFTQVGAYPLHLAAKRSHLEVLDALLDASAEVDAADQNGRTGLMIASASGQVAATEWLLNRRAAVDAVSHYGLSALHCAAVLPRMEIVALLLGAEASPDLTDRQGQTPLHLVLNSVPLRVERLQETSCDPSGYGDEYIYERNTSQGYGNDCAGAAESDHDRIVKGTAAILLQHGACADLRDERGRTPAKILEAKSRSDLHAWFIEESAKVRGSGERPTPADGAGTIYMFGGRSRMLALSTWVADTCAAVMQSCLPWCGGT